MPRESVHWFVLEETLVRLGEQTPLVRSAINEFRAEAMLGAIAHDAPYYYRSGRSEFERVAEHLHGSEGERTLSPIQQLLLYCRDSEGLLSPAFALGLLSHVATDSIMHPLIYFCTGDYYAVDPETRRNARRAHRLFEVFLDEYCKAQVRKKPTERIAILLGEAATRPTFAALMGAMNSLSEQCWSIRGHWAEALYDLGKVQGLCFSPIVGALAKLLATIYPPFRELEAISSFGRSHFPRFFAESLEFKNPVSGEMHRESIMQLINEAIERCMIYFQSCEEFLRGEIEMPLQGIPNPSLNFNIEGSKATDAKFFAEKSWV